MTTLSDLRAKVKELKKSWKKLKSTDGASKDEIKRLKKKYKKAKEERDALIAAGGERAEQVVKVQQGKVHELVQSVLIYKRPRTRSIDATLKRNPQRRRKRRFAKKRKSTSASELASNWLNKSKKRKGEEEEVLDDTIPEDECTPADFYKNITSQSHHVPTIRNSSPLVR